MVRQSEGGLWWGEAGGRAGRCIMQYIDDAFACDNDADKDRDDDQSCIDSTEMILIKTKVFTTFTPE